MNELFQKFWSFDFQNRIITLKFNPPYGETLKFTLPDNIVADSQIPENPVGCFTLTKKNKNLCFCSFDAGSVTGIKHLKRIPNLLISDTIPELRLTITEPDLKVKEVRIESIFVDEDETEAARVDPNNKKVVIIKPSKLGEEGKRFGCVDLLIISTDGREIKCPFEIVSGKLFKPDKPKEYFQKIDRMIEKTLQLQEEIQTYLLSDFSKTFFSMMAQPFLKPKYYLLYFLKAYFEDLFSAFTKVAADPYRALQRTRRWTPLWKVKFIDNKALEKAFAKGVPLTEVNGFPLPVTVYALFKVNTLNLPENRFVCHFARRLWLDINEFENELQQGPEVKSKKLSEPFEQKLHQLKCLLSYFMASPEWYEVSQEPLFQIPFRSTVLRMRDGYRQLLALYLKYMLGVFFGELQIAIENREAWRLYEYYCLRRIREMLEEWKKEALIIDPKFDPKRKELSLTFKNRYFKLEFQKSSKAYTALEPRPDFVLTYKENKSKIVLDAKFSTGDEHGRPHTSDIEQMHYYMDAIENLKAAIILYLGNENKFYCKNRKVIWENLSPELNPFHLGHNIGKILINPSLSGIGCCQLDTGNDQ